MRLSMRMLVAVVLTLSCVSAAFAADGFNRTAAAPGAQAFTEDRGYSIKPVFEMTRYIAGDEAPAQTFEVVRPGNGPVEFGRLFTSCSCVQLETPQRYFQAGERALFTLRNVKPTPAAGQVYQIYIQVVRPVATTLQYNVFVQSDRFVQQQQQQYAATDGQMYAGMDGYLPQ